MIGRDYSSNTNYYLNTTTEECNLSNFYNMLDESNQFTYNRFKAIESEITDIDSKLEVIDIKTIQFYPRVQRKCRNPTKITLRGVSMQPFLYDGDVIYADPVKFEDIELGDVISFNRGDYDKGTVHAVVGLYKSYLVTAGYNNERKDDLVYPEEVKYRFCEKIL